MTQQHLPQREKTRFDKIIDWCFDTWRGRTTAIIGGFVLLGGGSLLNQAWNYLSGN